MRLYKSSYRFVSRSTDDGGQKPAFRAASNFRWGEYPARSLSNVRSEALALTLAVEQGKDPLAKHRAKLDADTFEELSKLYMAEHKIRPASDLR